MHKKNKVISSPQLQNKTQRLRTRTHAHTQYSVLFNSTTHHSYLQRASLSVNTGSGRNQLAPFQLPLSVSKCHCRQTPSFSNKCRSQPALGESKNKNHIHRTNRDSLSKKKKKKKTACAYMYISIAVTML